MALKLSPTSAPGPLEGCGHCGPGIPEQSPPSSFSLELKRNQTPNAPHLGGSTKHPSYNTGKVPKGSQAIKTRLGSARGAEGRGREQSRLGLVRLLKKYSYKSVPLAELSPRCGQGRDKEASFKNQGTKEPKPPRAPKSFVHSKASEQRGAVPGPCKAAEKGTAAGREELVCRQ